MGSFTFYTINQVVVVHLRVPGRVYSQYWRVVHFETTCSAFVKCGSISTKVAVCSLSLCVCVCVCVCVCARVRVYVRACVYVCVCYILLFYWLLITHIIKGAVIVSISSIFVFS